ncbi:MAG: MOSC domain-containing protein [Chloroflexota bacterium]
MILDQRSAEARGIRLESSVDDQAALTHSLGQARLAAIHYYPIKSCAGHALLSATVEPRGLRYDREFMVVEAASGVMLTQREQPRMALVTPYCEREHLTLEAPGMKPLTVVPCQSGPAITTTIWKDQVASIDQGNEVAGWFSRYLGFACRLVRMASVTARPVNRDYALRETDVVSYADGFPFLVASEESLADLNARLADPVSMNRFRPNLVLAGCGIPFGEDYLRRFTLGPITFEAVKPCARCVITTVEQETAGTGREPLRTLAAFRRGSNGALFGQNLIHDRPGTLNVGEQVRVLETRSDSPVLE